MWERPEAGSLQFKSWKEGSEDPQSPREESPEKAIKAIKNRQKHIRGKRQVLETEDSKSQTTRPRED